MFETMNSRTQGSMHFVEIMKIGANVFNRVRTFFLATLGARVAQ
jgi:hypothetical protein